MNQLTNFCKKTLIKDPKMRCGGLQQQQQRWW